MEKKEKDYQICERCVMDTTDPDIVFDENGICNHCRDYFESEEKFVIKGKAGEKKLKEIINKIKEDGKNNKYDCILGVSGGVDSSYAAYLAKKYGLRVLLINLNNDYDTEIAKYNIKKIIENSNFDLFNYKIDLKEFKDLQLAYFKASVLDIEVATDHAIIAALYDIANKKRIKYILNGYNIVTENILPKSWYYDKNDLINLKSIHKRFGTVKLSTYPTLGTYKWLYYRFLKGIKPVSLLNYVNYNKIEAKKVIHKEFGWMDYGGKHYESIFTKFYQGYILPSKFHIDKRKAHLSTLICSGQITRETALNELEKPLYGTEELETDKNYVLKKLGLSEKEFEDFMNLPIKKHQEYGTQENKWMYLLLKVFKNIYTALSNKDIDMNY